MPVDEIPPLERSEGAMLTQVLAELAALRREVGEMKTTLSGGASGEGIYESNRALKRELLELTARVVKLETQTAAKIDKLDTQITALKDQLANMKDGGLKTAGRWLDNVMPVLIAALVLGLFGNLWLNITASQSTQRQSSVPSAQIYEHAIKK